MRKQNLLIKTTVEQKLNKHVNIMTLIITNITQENPNNTQVSINNTRVKHHTDTRGGARRAQPLTDLAVQYALPPALLHLLQHGDGLAYTQWELIIMLRSVTEHHPTPPTAHVCCNNNIIREKRKRESAATRISLRKRGKERKIKKKEKMSVSELNYLLSLYFIFLLLSLFVYLHSD